jgi:hypothetical protein
MNTEIPSSDIPQAAENLLMLLGIPGEVDTDRAIVRSLDDVRSSTSELLEQKDALLKALEKLIPSLSKTVAALTDEQIGTFRYMEGSEIYGDFERAAKIGKEAIEAARDAIARATVQGGAQGPTTTEAVEHFTT